MDRIDLKSKSLSELKEVFEGFNEKKFRANQVFSWIHQKHIGDIESITVLSKPLRDKLNETCKISHLKIVERFDSKIDETKKYLFLLEDGNIIESVMMRYKHGTTLCLSTQVGCRMGCNFCASTKGGLVRNLTAGEILDQIYKIEEDLNIRVSNIVLMGSGEPLDNYDNVMKFLYMIHEELGANIGYRHITMSTCGIVPKIYDLANEGLPINLSISLHGSTDEARRKIMPIAKRYSINEIIDACDYYINKTNRRITFEYTLIEGVNDSADDSKEVIRLLKGKLCHVNLIPLNPIKESHYEKSKNQSVLLFKKRLEEYGISTTVRREMGSDINAACGQLRKDYIENK